MEKDYKKVSGIVGKAQRTYYVKDWDTDDWHQEGMICLYQLLEKSPELVHDEKKLCTYFKVKFTNYVKDIVRRQESQKRRFDRMAYEEISEVDYEISDGLSDPSERYIFRQMLQEFRQGLNSQERSKYDLLIRGESFQGRKALLTQLRDYLEE